MHAALATLRRPFLVVLSLVGALLHSAVGHAAPCDVLTVGPGKDYPSIFAAVAAGQDEDVVLVEPGTYGFFGLIGKGMSVVAAGPGVRVEGQVRVQSIAPGQRVSLQGLEVRAVTTEALTVANCSGPVRIESCAFYGGGTGWYSTDRLGARLVNSLDVAIHGTWIHAQNPACINGPFGDLFCPSGGDALLIEESTLVLEESHCIGGHSAFIEEFPQTDDGKHGIRLESGSLTARGSTASGGSGSSYTTGPGSGGHGIYVAAGAQLRTLDCQLTEGGAGFTPPASWGATGDPIGGPGSGAAQLLTGPSPSAFATHVVQPGDPLTIEFAFVPNARTDLFVSVNDGSLFLPGLSGHLLLGTPLLRSRYLAGTTDANGALQWTIQAPSPFGGDSLRLLFQAGHRDPATGRDTLGPMQEVHVVQP